MANDILQPFPEDKLQAYIEIYKCGLPKTLNAHNFLVRHLKFGKDAILLGCKLDLFIPRDGDIKNATIFAIITNVTTSNVS